MKRITEMKAEKENYMGLYTALEKVFLIPPLEAVRGCLNGNAQPICDWITETKDWHDLMPEILVSPFGDKVVIFTATSGREITITRDEIAVDFGPNGSEVAAWNVFRNLPLSASVLVDGHLWKTRLTSVHQALVSVNGEFMVGDARSLANRLYSRRGVEGGISNLEALLDRLIESDTDRGAFGPLDITVVETNIDSDGSFYDPGWTERPA